MVTVEELAARLDRVETQLALQRLAADYCIGADQQDLGRFAAIWTQDAVWDAAGDDPDDEEHRFYGLEAITAAVQGQWATFPRMQHASANHVIDRDADDPDRAKGRCDVVVTVQLPDGRWVIGGGVYQDDYRRQNGTWRIASRRVIRPFDLQPLPASYGAAHVPTPDDEPSDRCPLSNPPTATDRPACQEGRSRPGARPLAKSSRGSVLGEGATSVPHSR